MIPQPWVDLGGLSRDQVRATLTAAAPFVRGEARCGAQRLRACGVGPVLDREDLESIGNVSALHAAVTYDPAKAKGYALEARIRVYVQWVIRDTVREVVNSQGRIVEHAPVYLAAHSLILHDQASAEDLVSELEALRWVERAASRLTPREQIIVMHRLAGDTRTDSELAELFGVDRAQVCRGLASAVSKLRRALHAPRSMGFAA